MQNQKAKKSLKKIIILFTLVAYLQINPRITLAATEIADTSITAYPLSDSRIETPGGWINPEDKCKITHISSEGYVRVTYPVPRGSRTVDVPAENFFINTEFSLNKARLGKQMTVHKKSDLAEPIGTVYADDEVIVIGNQGNRTQIIYPLSDGSGYKLGWIDEFFLPEGYYRIKSSINTKYVVDIYGASLDACANVQIHQTNDGDNQIYYIKRLFGHYYVIIAKHSGMVWDAEKGGTANGTNIIQYPLNGNGSDNQMWEISMNSNGTCSFRNKANGLYADVNGAIAENERNFQCWEGNDTQAQDFWVEWVCTKLFDEPGWLPAVTDNMIAGTSEQRTAVVDYLNACATIPWTTNEALVYKLKSSKGSWVWNVGVTHYGIPYSQSNRTTNLELFQENLTNSIYTGPKGQKTYMGSDCSSAVSMAYRTVNKNFPITVTTGMFPCCSYMKKVGDYNDKGLISSSKICQSNGKTVMFDAYRKLQPGDLLLSTEHVMMVTEVGDGYVKVTHQSGYSSRLSSSWRVNETYTYEKAFNGNYIPVTMSIW